MSMTNGQEKLINALIRIQDETPLSGQDYSVIVYVLTDEVGPNGEHGVFYIRGGYSCAKDAVNAAKELIDKYDINNVFAVPNCKWETLTKHRKSDRTIYTKPEKLNDMINHYASDSQSELKKQFENSAQAKLRDEISREQELADVPGTIENFTRLWYLLIKNTGSLKYHQSQVDHFTRKNIEREKELRKAVDEHPEYLEQWLPRLESKLKERNEPQLLELIKNGYHQLKSDGFDPKRKKD